MVVRGSIYSPPYLFLLFPIFLINTLSYVFIPRLICLLDPSSWLILHPSFCLIRSNKSAFYPSSLSCFCLRIWEQILATMKGQKHHGYWPLSKNALVMKEPLNWASPFCKIKCAGPGSRWHSTFRLIWEVGGRIGAKRRWDWVGLWGCQ